MEANHLRRNDNISVHLHARVRGAKGYAMNSYLLETQRCLATSGRTGPPVTRTRKHAPVQFLGDESSCAQAWQAHIGMTLGHAEHQRNVSAVHFLV